MPGRPIKVIKQVTDRPTLDHIDAEVPHDVDSGMIRAVEHWVDERRENGRRERRVSVAAIAAWKASASQIEP